nr:putative 2-dehydropantoate 2-reductase [Quercus suber]
MDVGRVAISRFLTNKRLGVARQNIRWHSFWSSNHSNSQMDAKAYGDSSRERATEDLEHTTKEDHNALDEQDQDLTKSMDSIDQRYTPVRDVEQRIHIVGTGSIGKLVAWALRGLPNPPPVTLIFHKAALCKAWEEGKQEVTIQDGQFPVPRSGFAIELQRHVEIHHGVVRDPSHDPDPYDDSRRPHEVAKYIRRERQQRDEAGFNKTNSETVTYMPTVKRVTPSAGKETVDDDSQTGENASSRPFDQWPHFGWAKYYVDTPIDNLIVTTKAATTITALTAIRHRLTRESTICFLQNGMGMIDEVNEKVFPNEAERPTYIQGILTHGVNVPREVARTNPFFAVHAGRGTIALGVLPQKDYDGLRPPADSELDDAVYGQRPPADAKWTPTTRYMLRTLTRSPILCAVGHTAVELLQLQLEKLAVNSILNPLTSLLDCRNGHLNANDGISRTMRLMLAETSLVINSLPELRSIPGVPMRFSSKRLEQICKSVANTTSENISSMLADVRAGNRTEIDYINGYIVKRGDELGIKCVVNYAIMQTVKAKQMVVKRELADEVPYDHT